MPIVYRQAPRLNSVVRKVVAVKGEEKSFEDLKKLSSSLVAARVANDLKTLAKIASGEI